MARQGEARVKAGIQAGGRARLGQGQGSAAGRMVHALAGLV
jgi:hypothetical protein